MILLSKYKGQHGGKKGKKIRAGPTPPPPFRAMPERNRFFPVRCSLRPKADIVWFWLFFFFKKAASLKLKECHTFRIWPPDQFVVKWYRGETVSLIRQSPSYTSPSSLIAATNAKNQNGNILIQIAATTQQNWKNHDLGEIFIFLDGPWGENCKIPCHHCINCYSSSLHIFELQNTKKITNYKRIMWKYKD